MTNLPYHSTSNGQAEPLVGTFKRALNKGSNEKVSVEALQTFFTVSWITPNPNTISGMSPIELMFARKMKSMSDKLLPDQKGITTDNKITQLFSKLAGKCLRT